MRGALLRLGRQPDQAPGRRSLCDQSHAPATSKWSDINRRRWHRLEAAGQLATAGVAMAPTANRYLPKPAIPELPAYIADAFKTNAKAWQHFQALAARERRNYVVWIHTAKRIETRERRIRES